MKKIVSTAAIATLALAAFAAPANIAERTEAKTFAGADGVVFRYRWAEKLPDDGSKVPLVIFLHGAGERGTNNVAQLKHGVEELLNWLDRHEKGYRLVAGQVPNGKRWAEVDWGAMRHTMLPKPSETMELELALIDKLLSDQRTDARRVYVTGISMGGYGTWDIICRRPQLFVRGGHADLRRRRHGPGGEDCQGADLGVPRLGRQGRAGIPFAEHGLGALGGRLQRALPRIPGCGAQRLDADVSRRRSPEVVLLAEKHAPGSASQEVRSFQTVIRTPKKESHEDIKKRVHRGGRSSGSASAGCACWNFRRTHRPARQGPQDQHRLRGLRRERRRRRAPVLGREHCWPLRCRFRTCAADVRGAPEGEGVPRLAGDAGGARRPDRRGGGVHSRPHALPGGAARNRNGQARVRAETAHPHRGGGAPATSRLAPPQGGDADGQPGTLQREHEAHEGVARGGRRK